MGQVVAIAVPILKGLDIVKKTFFPDMKLEDIVGYFHQLYNRVVKVSNEVEGLEKKMKWEEIAELQYKDVVERIQLGMQYCVEIGKANGEANGKAEIRYQDRLKELCANGNITLALDTLLDGIIGNGRFQKSILDHVDNETNGDRQKMSALAERLQMLVRGGMIVLVLYKTLTSGEDGAKKMEEQYSTRLNEANVKLQEFSKL